MQILDSTIKERYMTITEAAEVKGVNRSSVRKAITSGRLSYTKIGSVYLVLRDQVDKWYVVGHRPEGWRKSPKVGNSQ